MLNYIGKGLYQFSFTKNYEQIYKKLKISLPDEGKFGSRKVLNSKMTRDHLLGLSDPKQQDLDHKGLNHGYRKKTRYILRYRKCDLDTHMPPVGTL